MIKKVPEDWQQNQKMSMPHIHERQHFVSQLQPDPVFPIAHVLSHTQAGYKDPPHSVFLLTSRDKLFDVLDEGWSKPSSSRLQGLDKDGNPDPEAWVVEMDRQIGEQATETKIRYIIKSGTTGDIITAYPVSGLQP